MSDRRSFLAAALVSAAVFFVAPGTGQTAGIEETARKFVASLADKAIQALTRQVVPRRDISRIERVEVSLMPPGQLQGMSDAEVRDLIAYLKEATA